MIIQTVADDDFFCLFLLQLTFSHQVGRHKGIIEYESQSRLCFALSLFSCAGLPNSRAAAGSQMSCLCPYTYDTYILRSFSVADSIMFC